MRMASYISMLCGSILIWDSWAQTRLGFELRAGLAKQNCPRCKGYLMTTLMRGIADVSGHVVDERATERTDIILREAYLNK